MKRIVSLLLSLMLLLALVPATAETAKLGMTRDEVIAAMGDPDYSVDVNDAIEELDYNTEIGGLSAVIAYLFMDGQVFMIGGYAFSSSDADTLEQLVSYYTGLYGAPVAGNGEEFENVFLALAGAQVTITELSMWNDGQVATWVFFVEFGDGPLLYMFQLDAGFDLSTLAAQ